MSKGIRDQLRGLAREQERLEALLAGDENWRALKATGAAASEDDDRLALLADDAAQALRANPVSKVHANIVRARRLLAELIPPDEETQDGSAETGEPAQPKVFDVLPESSDLQAGDAFRTKVKVKAAWGDVDRQPDQAAAARPMEIDISGVDLSSGDDLERIRCIDTVTAKRLHVLGVKRYETIALWNKAEVGRIRDALGLGRRIHQENWIEQAAMLSSKISARSEHDAHFVPLAADMAVETSVKADPGVDAAADGGSPNIERTDALQAARPPRSFRMPALLTHLVSKPGSRLIAMRAAARRKASPTDEHAASQTEPAPGPMAFDRTAAASDDRIASGLRAGAGLLSDADPPAKTHNSVAVSGDAPPAPAALPSGFARVPRPANDDEPGRLAQIAGVSSHHIELLAAAGVTRCSEVAAWTASDVERFQSFLGPDAAISSDQWIEQAAILARGRTTRFARRQAVGLDACLTPRPVQEDWSPRLTGLLMPPATDFAPASAPAQFYDVVAQSGEPFDAGAMRRDDARVSQAEPAAADPPADAAPMPVDWGAVTANIRLPTLPASMDLGRAMAAPPEPAERAEEGPSGHGGRMAEPSTADEAPGWDEAALRDAEVRHADLNNRISELEKTIAGIRPPAAWTRVSGADPAPAVAGALPAGTRSGPGSGAVGSMPGDGHEAAQDRLRHDAAGGDAVLPPIGIRPGVSPVEGEADVEIVIVRREAADADRTPKPVSWEAVSEDVRRVSEPKPSTSWLARRIASYDVDEDDTEAGQDYAGYQSTVQEATVQIVRRAGDGAGSPGAEGMVVPPPASDVDGGGRTSGGFGRFLRALTGD